MHLITEKPIPKGAPNTGKGAGKALKDKIVNKAKDVISMPKRAYTNYKGRTDDTNKYKSILHWAKNKN